MVLDLEAILAAASTGAITGYLTNNLALKMIFKQYGPFGGVVIKTKKEFITAISELVERELINHHSLEAEFSRPEFKASFARMIADFYEKDLYEQTKNLNIADLPGWQKNYQHLSNFFLKSGFDLAAGLGEFLARNYQLEDLLAKEKINKLVSDLYTILVAEFSTAENLAILETAIYDDLKAERLTDLITDEQKDKLFNLITDSAAYFVNNYYNSAVEVKKITREKLLNFLGMEKFIDSLLKETSGLALTDLLAEDQLNDHQKKAGLETVIHQILLNLKLELKNSEFKLADFIDSEVEQEILKLSKVLINDLAEAAYSFVARSESDLNELIFKAVEAEIAASNGLKAMSRSAIYNKYQENIADYGTPISYLKSYLKKSLPQSSEKLSQQLLQVLKQLKIKDLLDLLNLEEIAAQLVNSGLNFYQLNKQQTLESLLSLNSKNKFAASKKQLPDLILKVVEQLFSSQTSIKLLLNYVLDLELGDLISAKNPLFGAEMPAKLADFLKKEEKVPELLTQYLLENGLVILANQLTKVSNAEDALLKEKAAAKIRKSKAKAAQLSLTEIYRLQPDKKQAVADLTEKILNFFYNNMSGIIDGKVAGAASANLNKLSDQEVEQAIADFMGKELKPITYLGALLGAGAGLIFTMSGAESFILNSGSAWSDYLATAFLYGGVGWLTNVLAIWMIFNPHQKQELAGVRVPFTPGVVAKNKARFANSMGKFVEQELLKADSAAELIAQHETQLKNKIFNYLSSNDYQFIFAAAKNKKDEAAQKLAALAVDYLANLKTDVISDKLNYLTAEIGNYLANELSELDYQKQLLNYLKQLPSDQSESESAAFLGDLTNFNFDQFAKLIAGQHKLEFSSSQLKNILSSKKFYPFLAYLMPVLAEKKFTFDLQLWLSKHFKAKQSDYYQKLIELILNQNQEAKLAKLINLKKDELLEQEKAKSGGLLKNTLVAGALYMADLDQFIENVTGRVFKELRENYLPEKNAELQDLLVNTVVNLAEHDLNYLKKFELNKSLALFFKNPEAFKLMREVIYLSEEQFDWIMDNLLPESEQVLLKLQIELNPAELDYFIEQHFDLPEKLKLLISFQQLFKLADWKKTLTKLLQQEKFTETELRLRKIIGNLELQERLSDLNLIDSPIFTDSAANLADILAAGPGQKFLEQQIAEQINNLADYLSNNFNRQSLDYLFNLVIEAGLISLKNNSADLLAALELENLTAAEVNKMNPAEIEQLFNSFAGQYFSQLKQYGWSGGIFGIIQLVLRTMF